MCKTYISDSFEKLGDQRKKEILTIRVSGELLSKLRKLQAERGEQSLSNLVRVVLNERIYAQGNRPIIIKTKNNKRKTKQ